MAKYYIIDDSDDNTTIVFRSTMERLADNAISANWKAHRSRSMHYDKYALLENYLQTIYGQLERDFVGDHILKIDQKEKRENYVYKDENFKFINLGLTKKDDKNTFIYGGFINAESKELLKEYYISVEGLTDIRVDGNKVKWLLFWTGSKCDDRFSKMGVNLANLSKADFFKTNIYRMFFNPQESYEKPNLDHIYEHIGRLPEEIRKSWIDDDALVRCRKKEIKNGTDLYKNTLWSCTFEKELIKENMKKKNFPGYMNTIYDESREKWIQNPRYAIPFVPSKTALERGVACAFFLPLFLEEKPSFALVMNCYINFKTVNVKDYIDTVVVYKADTIYPIEWVKNYSLAVNGNIRDWYNNYQLL